MVVLSHFYSVSCSFLPTIVYFCSYLFLFRVPDDWLKNEGSLLPKHVMASQYMKNEGKLASRSKPKSYAEDARKQIVFFKTCKKPGKTSNKTTKNNEIYYHYCWYKKISA